MPKFSFEAISPSSIVTNGDRLSPDAPMAAFRMKKVGNREWGMGHGASGNGHRAMGFLAGRLGRQGGAGGQLPITQL
ncbi:hypothetical protein [Tolypothrix sp. VBCCA 56010]|uniref:hypothetical protein n=1 Tax=Tolypothrix sp. VBCCA 56010 TaxID=3137731 RepID=UPI003D7D48BC